MDTFGIERWLALWEPQLVGQPPEFAAAQVTTAGFVPQITYYLADPGSDEGDVVTILVGDNGRVRRVSRS